MQFTPDMVTAILAGRKTRTTRPQRIVGVRTVLHEMGEVSWHDVYEETCSYKVGHDYAVCPGRGKRQVARILIQKVVSYPFFEGIPGREEHARKEGFANWPTFHDKWWDLYHNDEARLLGPVWVIDFELRLPSIRYNLQLIERSDGTLEWVE